MLTPPLSIQARQRDIPRFWIQAGFGVSSLNWMVAAAASYQHRGHVFSARFAEAHSELLEGGDEMRDMGILYGRVLRTGRQHVSVGAGLGRVVCSGYRGCGRSDARPDQPEYRAGVGIPIELQLGWRPLRLAGLGLYTQANLNTIASFAGVAVTLQLGPMH